MPGVSSFFVPCRIYMKQESSKVRGCNMKEKLIKQIIMVLLLAAALFLADHSHIGVLERGSAVIQSQMAAEYTWSDVKHAEMCIRDRPQIVQNFKRGQRQKLFSCQPEKFIEFSERKTEEHPYTATLRIAEGCNNCCAYCVIPQIRGKYRSRPMENILQEAEERASKGYKEVILIAQDVTEYGDVYKRQTIGIPPSFVFLLQII